MTDTIKINSINIEAKKIINIEQLNYEAEPNDVCKFSILLTNGARLVIEFPRKENEKNEIFFKRCNDKRRAIIYQITA